MLLVQGISSAAKQKQRLILPTGKAVELSISYSQNQFGWFIDLLSYEGNDIRGLRIVTSPNLLHQFKNKLRFGLACEVFGNREPTNKEDFSSGAAKLYLLDEAEVATVTGIINGEAVS